MKTLLNSCSIRGSTQKRRINSLGLLMRGLLMQKRRIDPLGLPKQIRQDQRSPREECHCRHNIAVNKNSCCIALSRLHRGCSVNQTVSRVRLL